VLVVDSQEIGCFDPVVHEQVTVCMSFSVVGLNTLFASQRSQMLCLFIFKSFGLVMCVIACNWYLNNHM
jgi:hypothetical protein